MRKLISMAIAAALALTLSAPAAFADGFVNEEEFYEDFQNTGITEGDPFTQEPLTQRFKANNTAGNYQREMTVYNEKDAVKLSVTDAGSAMAEISAVNLPKLNTGIVRYEVGFEVESLNTLFRIEHWSGKDRMRNFIMNINRACYFETGLQHGGNVTNAFNPKIHYTAVLEMNYEDRTGSTWMETSDGNGEIKVIPILTNKSWQSGAPNWTPTKSNQWADNGCTEIRIHLDGVAGKSNSLIINEVRVYRPDPTLRDNKASISGIVANGHTITAEYTLVDAWLAGDDSQIQWYVSDTADGFFRPISGANQKDYTCKPEDSRKYIRCGVLPRNTLGKTGVEVFSEPMFVKVGTPPEVTSVSLEAPYVLVNAEILPVYAYTHSKGTPEGESRFQWYISDTYEGTYKKIEGATSKAYLASEAELGKFIKCEVTPVDEKEVDGDARLSGMAAEVVAPVTISLQSAENCKVNQLKLIANYPLSERADLLKFSVNGVRPARAEFSGKECVIVFNTLLPYESELSLEIQEGALQDSYGRACEAAVHSFVTEKSVRLDNISTSSVTLDFSNNILLPDNDNFTITQNGEAVKPAFVARLNGSKYSLIFANPLSPDTEFTVEVTGIVDEYGSNINTSLTGIAVTADSVHTQLSLQAAKGFDGAVKTAPYNGATNFVIRCTETSGQDEIGALLFAWHYQGDAFVAGGKAQGLVMQNAHIDLETGFFLNGQTDKVTFIMLSADGKVISNQLTIQPE